MSPMIFRKKLSVGIIQCAFLGVTHEQNFNLSKLVCGLDQSPTVMVGKKHFFVKIGSYQTPVGLWSRPIIQKCIKNRAKCIMFPYLYCFQLL